MGRHELEAAQRESGAWDYGGEGGKDSAQGLRSCTQMGSCRRPDLGTMLSLLGKQWVHGVGDLGVDQLKAQAGARMES